MAAILGGVAAYIAATAFGSGSTGGASMRDMLSLMGAGLALIIIALHGRLMRAFFISFTLIFFVVLAVATHGFASL